jgi:ribonuclease T2
VGQTITATQVRNAFEDRFGDGSGDKIKIACKRDGNRLLITEITIGLQGELDEVPMSEALFAAPRANNIGCKGGIVDPVGLQ